MSRDTQLGIKFVGTMFYDGQGFMVRKADGIASALDLCGAAICIESGTTTELNAADYFAANSLEFNTVVFVDQDEVVKAYEDGRCDVYTTDSSALAAERSKFADPGRSHHPARDHLQGAARPRGRVRATTAGSTSRAGPTTRCSKPKSSA